MLTVATIGGVAVVVVAAVVAVAVGARALVATTTVLRVGALVAGTVGAVPIGPATMATSVEVVTGGVGARAGAVVETANQAYGLYTLVACFKVQAIHQPFCIP